jgi:hypothetical protein
MHARHSLHAKSLIASCAVLGALLSACGGYGGGSYSGGGPGATCGGTYNVACPPPTVTLTAPAANATVSGMVTLTATAAASAAYNLTVVSVNFEVDATSVGTAMASPYTVTWDSTTVANGAHTLTAIVTDSAHGTTTSGAVMVTVTNAAAAAAATMGPGQIFPAPASKASGVAHFSVRADNGAVSGTVNLRGLNATAVTLNEGFAGTSGEALMSLAPRAGHAGEWEVPGNATLSAAQLAAFGAGRVYVLATSAAHPAGEIRGQLAPAGVHVTFSALSAVPEAEAQGLNPAGVAASTLDAKSGTLTVHVSSAGIEDASAAQLSGSTGAQLRELARDPVDMGHFSAERTRLSAAEIADFEAGRLSVTVAAARLPEGALVGAIGPER